MKEKEFTPEQITHLDEYEIFVFGSNLKGDHAGGAAKLALDCFGAKKGVGEGIQGNSYAIPTLDKKMKKVTSEALANSLTAFADFATHYSSNKFYLTKIGCGIAGFNEVEVAKLVHAANLPENVIIPEDFQITESFKGFDKDLKCRDYAYTIGGTFTQEQQPRICDRGFHSCQHPLGVLSFYPNKNGARYCEVLNVGKIDKSPDGDTKIASKTIEITGEVGLPGLLKASVKYVRSIITDATTGDYAHSATTGIYAHSATTGYYAHSATTGNYAHSATTGYKAHSATTGYKAHSATTGGRSTQRNDWGLCTQRNDWGRSTQRNDW